MDAYMASKVFKERTRLSGPGWETSGNPTRETVLELFNKLMLVMNNKRVPMLGRILYVTPETAMMINWNKEVVKAQNINTSSASILTDVSQINQVRIEQVPPELMLTAYDFHVPRHGFQALPDARQIHMLLIHPVAVLTPVRYNFAQLDPPSAGSQGKWVYYEEAYEDVFVLKNKADAVQAIVSPAGKAAGK